MTQRNNKYEKPKTFRIVQNTCSVCGLKSKSVEKSIIYNNYFCMDCLIDHVKNN